MKINDYKTQGYRVIKASLGENGIEKKISTNTEAVIVNVKNKEHVLHTTDNKMLKIGINKEEVVVKVVNNAGQEGKIKMENMPKELRMIKNERMLEAYLKDAHARVALLDNGEISLHVEQNANGGMKKKHDFIAELLEKRRLEEEISRKIINQYNITDVSKQVEIKNTVSQKVEYNYSNSFGNMDFTPLVPYSTTPTPPSISCNIGDIGSSIKEGAAIGLGGATVGCLFPAASGGLGYAPCVGLGVLTGAAAGLGGGMYNYCSFKP